MSAYTREILKVVVAKICQTIGWHNIQSTSLEIMVDILRRYITELTKLTHAYSTQFGHTQPNLDELGLAFRDMHINISDLEEFVRYVDFGLPIEVPQFPVKKESHLNFLKPGSDEVITRAVHIHEHLPPMLPYNEEAELTSSSTVKAEDTQSSPNMDTGTAIFKRPADISPNEIPMKRPRLVMEEEGRPTREISSVMMTTSGFLSPAREGKLPESRTPINTVDTPNALISHLGNNIGNEPKFEKKSPKIFKKTDKRKEKLSKELFKTVDEMMPKKTTMKDVVKMKAMKANAAHQILMNSGPQLFDPTPIKTSMNKPPTAMPKQSKSQQKQIKTEKLFALTTTTANPKTLSQSDRAVEEKLYSEPDKLKLNIFKKISKNKEDKLDKTDKVKVKDEPRTSDIVMQESRGSSPDLIIDESDNMKNWEPKSSSSKLLDLVVKQDLPELTPSKAVTNMEIVSKIFETVRSPRSDKDFIYDDNISPPGTPSTPKTPEMPSNFLPLQIEKEIKRKRKDKGKVKNKSKIPKYSMSPRRNKSESLDTELDRPRTPDGSISDVKEEPLIIAPPQTTVPQFSFFQNYIPAPGLIPTPIGMPMFPRMPITGGRPNHGFGQPAHIPQAMPALPFVSPAKVVEEHLEKLPTPIVQEPVKPQKLEFPVVETKEKHKKDKKDKIKKKNKKDKLKNKSEKRKLKEEKKEQKEKEKIKKEKKEKKKDKEREHEGAVPKLTLKIGSPRPPTPDVQVQRKILIKPVVKKEELPTPASSDSVEVDNKREPSPELARISALITRPPKPKSSTIDHDKSHRYLLSPNESSFAPNVHAKLKKSMLKALPKLKNCKFKRMGARESEIVSETDILIPTVPDTAPSSFYFDNDGNKVWICPACGRQDDGSPMIGCDDCDAWYHWVCVGIQVPPDDSEDWYCRICIVKKQETLQMDKKKKRKKKERKEYQ